MQITHAGYCIIMVNIELRRLGTSGRFLWLPGILWLSLCLPAHQAPFEQRSTLRGRIWSQREQILSFRRRSLFRRETKQLGQNCVPWSLFTPPPPLINGKGFNYWSSCLRYDFVNITISLLMLISLNAYRLIVKNDEYFGFNRILKQTH